MSIALTAYGDFDTGGTIVSWQRNNDGSATDVVLSGAYATTTPTNVEAQLDGGAFVTLSAETIAAGAWTGTLPAVTSGSRTLVVRMSNDHAQTATAELMLGDFFLICGDSIAVGQNITSSVSTVASPRNRYSHNGVEWVRADLTPDASAWQILVGLLAADQSVPVGFINAASSGTHTGQWESGTLPDNAVAAVAGAFLNRIRFVMWQIGTNDVISGGNQTASAIQTSLTAAVSYMNGQLPAPAIHLHGVFGNCPSSTGTLRTVEDQVRLGILNTAAAGVTNVGAIMVDLVETDGTHPDQSEANILAQRWWAAISDGVYGHADRRGPRVNNIYMASSTLAVVSFDQNLWTASLTASAFRVTDNGTPITVNLADIGPLDNQVQLTLNSAASGPVLVSYASGNDATGAVVPIRYAITCPDASTTFLPAEPQVDRGPQTSARAI